MSDVNRWTSVEALMENSKSEQAIKTRDQLTELSTSLEFKMSKVFIGFSK